MADVQIAVIDPEDTQLALAAPAEAVVNVAVPGIQGPIGTTGSVTIAQAGTAATPGIRFESDTNTGIYSPGADQLAISTGGTGQLFIDSSGRVGIGTSSPGEKLHILTSSNKDVRIANASHNTLTAGLSSAITFSRASDGTADLSALFGWNNGGVVLAAREEIVFANGGSNTYSATTERLRIDSSGRVGIGTSSPSSLLHLADAGDISVGTTTGTKIGTATTQKIGFYNATPVVQPTAVANATDAATVITQLNALLTRMRNLGLIAT